MGPRRIVIDSDDDIDDFPSLRQSPPALTAATKPAGLEIARVQAPAKTPKPSTFESRGGAGAEAVTAPASTAVRRRKLGKINNDASLLRPWGDKDRSIPDTKRRSFESPDIDLPHNTASRLRRPKPRVELRTRKTRRISELPADDEGELSTEEATVLEDVTLEDGVDGENDDDDDDNTLESDSEASEFQDASSDSNSSLGSLDDFFSRSPTKRPAATKATTRRTTTRRTSNEKKSAQKKKAPASQSQTGFSRYADEESSVFFSAEESLPDPLAEPMSHLSLHRPSRTAATKHLPTKPTLEARTSRPGTPPLEPPAASQAAGLVSPTKKLPRIPQTPHRASTDAFWNQMVVDDWNMEHSPRKLLFDPDDIKKNKRLQDAGTKATATPAAPSPLKKGTTAVAREREAKKQFQKTKHDMAEKFLAELDSAITNGELGRLAAATGGVRIEWTNKLNTTAGRANWRRETLRPKKGASTIALEEGSVADTGATAAATRILHHASIELAEKVIDDEHRLLNVIAHEFCHLANFMVGGITGNPHGKEFKAWAVQCSRHFGDRGIQVTTKHAYEIDFKYVWMCEACATEFKRHSKSIDPARHRCGACKGVLKQTKPVPRGGGARAAATAGGEGTTATPGPSAYQKFMKEHMAAVRRENPDSPQKVIMKLVADKWTKAKELKKASSSFGTEVQGEADVKPAKGTDVSVGQLDKVFVDLTLN